MSVSCGVRRWLVLYFVFTLLFLFGSWRRIMRLFAVICLLRLLRCYFNCYLLHVPTVQKCTAEAVTRNSSSKELRLYTRYWLISLYITVAPSTPPVLGIFRVVILKPIIMHSVWALPPDIVFLQGSPKANEARMDCWRLQQRKELSILQPKQFDWPAATQSSTTQYSKAVRGAWRPHLLSV